MARVELLTRTEASEFATLYRNEGGEEYLGMLEEYRLSDYLAIMQKYLDAYYA